MEEECRGVRERMEGRGGSRGLPLNYKAVILILNFLSVPPLKDTKSKQQHDILLCKCYQNYFVVRREENSCLVNQPKRIRIFPFSVLSMD